METVLNHLKDAIQMKYSLPLAICFLLLAATLVQAQGGKKGGGKSKGGERRGGGATPDTAGDNPQEVGEAGVAWYTTWETGLKEAKRSNRPIFFMSAATTCAGGVSGVF